MQWESKLDGIRRAEWLKTIATIKLEHAFVMSLSWNQVGEHTPELDQHS